MSDQLDGPELWLECQQRFYDDGANGKRVHLGTFETLRDAVRARKLAERDSRYHPNHGKRRATARRPRVKQDV